MNKKIILSVIIALCAAMSGCAAENNEENVLFETEAVTQSVISSETTSETTTVTTAETTEIAETAETTETAMTEDSSEKISVKSEDMSFTDFAFYECYTGTKDAGELGEKATEFLKSTEEYAQSQNYSYLYKDEFSDYFDEHGNIVPKIRASYPEDYDGDGKTETFLLVDIPYSNYINTEKPENSFSAVYSFLIFADSEQNMSVIDYNCGMHYPNFLDYGNSKQIVIGGSGSCGAEDHTIIWGVRDGKAVSLYGFRGGVYKQDCFISVFGWQSMGGMMLFDPERCCYIPVDGVMCDKDEIMKMDTDKTLEILYDEDYGIYSSVSLIGGKYYCVDEGFMDAGAIYTYSDGRFIPENNSNIRNNHIYAEDMNINANEVLVDFDYDEVVSEMTKVKAVIPTYSVDDMYDYSKKWIKEEYAAFLSNDNVTYTADEVEVTGFYGVYDGYMAVKLSGSSEVVIFIPYDYYDTRKANFLDIETAHSRGYLSDENLELLKDVLNQSE